MQLEINDETYEFRFGMKFLVEANKRWAIDEEARSRGLNSALDVITMNFLRNDPQMLAEVLKVANLTETPKVSLDKIYNYFDENGVDNVFEEVRNTLKESPSLGTLWKTATNQLETELQKQSR